MRKSKLNAGSNAAFQSVLFSPPKNLPTYPEVNRDISEHSREYTTALEKYNKHPDIILGDDKSEKARNSYLGTPIVGLDFEFTPGTLFPTIHGVSVGEKVFAGKYTKTFIQRVCEDCVTGKTYLAGHSTIGAEKALISKWLNIDIPTSRWLDSMVLHYLLNSDWCKAPEKEEEESTGGLGFMNLWTCASIYTNLPNWKQCKGRACEGTICPTHDEEGYCGVDAYASAESVKSQLSEMSRWNIPMSLYNDVMVTGEICQKMQDKGVKLDIKYIEELDKQFDAKKDALFGADAKYNPKSPYQGLKYFNSIGAKLDAFDKETIFKKLEVYAHKSNIYAPTSTELCEKLENAKDLPEITSELLRIYKYKNAGKGTKAWFDDKYIDKDNLVHARFSYTGTSTGRFSCSSPNYQNIPKRGFGSLVRGAIIPRSEDYDLLKADFSQLELRMVLFLASVDPRGISKDAFSWLVEQAGGLFDKAAELTGDSPRQVAKSISHAADYLEGFKLLWPNELDDPRIKKEAAFGALKIYHPKFMPGLKKAWTFRNKIVAFTGANIAERILGQKTLENRKKMLQIQEDVYFKAFPQIRQWHMKVLAELEDKGYVQSIPGRLLRLYSKDEDDCKAAVAFYGQGTSADHVQAIMRFYYKLGEVPILQVHDELVFEIPRIWHNDKARDFIRHMAEETKTIPGFMAPFKAYRGRRWLEKAKDNSHIDNVMVEI